MLHRPHRRSSAVQVILGLLLASLAIAIRYAVPLLNRKLAYKKLKRGVLTGILLLVPGSFAVTNFVADRYETYNIPASAIVLTTMLLWSLFVYSMVLRRSAGLLRWMPPQEELQPMRRRMHLPLVRTGQLPIDETVQPVSSVLSYAIHADPADNPLVRFVERVFRKEGHSRVAATDNPQHHIAILSNRSSQSWAQQVTQVYAGNLVFIVASTIEFKDSLADTGRYQWVDARHGKRQDIVSLAHSLVDADRHKREVALEATAAMIDTWKVPDGIALLKKVMEIVAIFLLVFGLTDIVGFVMELLGLHSGGTGDPLKSLVLVLVSAIFLWLASRALVYRKVAAPIFYGILALSFVLVIKLQFLPARAKLDEAPVTLTLWAEYWWVTPVMILFFTLYAASISYFWLPALARIHPEEVGIKTSIDRAFQRRNLLIVLGWVVAIVGIVVLLILKDKPV